MADTVPKWIPHPQSDSARSSWEYEATLVAVTVGVPVPQKKKSAVVFAKDIAEVREMVREHATKTGYRVHCFQAWPLGARKKGSSGGKGGGTEGGSSPNLPVPVVTPGGDTAPPKAGPAKKSEEKPCFLEDLREKGILFKSSISRAGIEVVSTTKGLW